MRRIKEGVIAIIRLIVPYSFIQYLIEKLLRYSYGGGNIQTSGELDALKYVCNRLNSHAVGQELVLFDVGANVGNYSLVMSKYFAEPYHIYAFEPLNSTFHMLEERISVNPFIKCYNFGFSSEEISMPIYTNASGSGMSSVYQRRLDHFGLNLGESVECKFSTIDNFCAANHLDRLNFLKIDVEGHELSVLKGAQKMIENGQIDFIQFEFAGCNIDSRTFFQDFWYLLKDKYSLYRIYPHGLYPIKKYTELCEIFICTNYLAELKSIKDN